MIDAFRWDGAWILSAVQILHKKAVSQKHSSFGYGDVQHADESTLGVGGKEEIRKMNKQLYH